MKRQCMIMNHLKHRSLSYVDDCNLHCVIQWLLTLVWTIDSYALEPRPTVYSVLELWWSICGKAVG